MKTKLFLVVAVIMILVSCKTGSFTSRRYMSGHYKANHASVKKPDAQPLAKNEKKTNHLRPSAETLSVQPETNPDELIASAHPKKIFTEKKHTSLNNLSVHSVKKEPKLITFMKEMFTSPSKNELKTGKSDEKISQKSLIGFACGVGAIAIDVICFIIAVGTLSYAPLAGMLVGLVLGVLGIIFGTQGIKDYKSSRNTPTLVFGIVGAATGLIGIILAFYLGIYGAVWVSLYGI
jgi:hypothetical protein